MVLVKQMLKMKNFKIQLPTYQIIGKKKHHLSYNRFILLHYHLKNKIKIKYSEIVKDKLEEQNLCNIMLKKIKVSYEIYPKSKAKFDILNLITIIDKFSLDTLTNNKVIEDDNYKIVEYGEMKFVDYDKDKLGYVIMKIEEIK
jgi:hypothetical protein